MIKYKPHHFLCTLGFQGKGYSNEFVENFAEIAATLRGPCGDEVSIEVTQYSDSICAPCPHRRNDLCDNQSKITKLDKAHAKVLKIKPGDVLTWGEAKQRIADQVSLEEFNKICAPCSWKKLGVCETALKNLKKL